MSKRNNWRNVCAVAAVAATLLLSGCTTQMGSIDENGLRPHLNVDLQIPEDLALEANNPFRINVMQNGEPVTADHVQFEFWPEGKPDQLVALEGVKTSEGVYAVDYRLKENGVYVVRCQITSGLLEAMPAKRFAIGEEAVLQLAALEEQDGSGNTAPASGGHHHH